LISKLRLYHSRDCICHWTLTYYILSILLSSSEKKAI